MTLNRAVPPRSTPVHVPGVELLERVDAVGMGDVYAARDGASDRPLALKIYGPRWCRPNARDAVDAQIALANRARHPALLPAWSGCTEDGRVFVANDWVNATSLAEASMKLCGPMDAPMVAALLAPVALALDALHERGVVHRSVTPAKILLCSEPGRTIVLTGIGAAPLLVPEGGRRTRQTTEVTSPAAIDYVAPECDDIARTDHRVDVYALAVIAYEMLTERHPYPRRDSVVRALVDRRERAPWLRDAVSIPFPPALRRWLGGCPRSPTTVSRAPARSSTLCETRAR